HGLRDRIVVIAAVRDLGDHAAQAECVEQVASRLTARARVAVGGLAVPSDHGLHPEARKDRQREHREDENEERHAGARSQLAGVSSTTTLRSVPISGTWTSTVSPLRKYFGGSKRAPAPVGVPVAMRSPGVRRMKLDRYSMSRANGKIRFAVVSSCRSSPLTRVIRCSSASGAISSAVTSHGPRLPERSKFLPGVTLNFEWRSQSRTEPSFISVRPATCCHASAAAMRRPPLPITSTISPS